MILNSELLNVDTFQPMLNILPVSIAYKYCEGKLKRTLKRELKEYEIANKEAYRVLYLVRGGK